MALYWFEWSMVGCSCISNDLAVHFCLQWSSCTWTWLLWSPCESLCRDLKPGVCLYTPSSITVRSPDGSLGIGNNKYGCTHWGKKGYWRVLWVSPLHIFPSKVSQERFSASLEGQIEKKTLKEDSPTFSRKVLDVLFCLLVLIILETMAWFSLPNIKGSLYS